MSKKSLVKSLSQTIVGMDATLANKCCIKARFCIGSWQTKTTCVKCGNIVCRNCCVNLHSKKRTCFNCKKEEPGGLAKVQDKIARQVHTSIQVAKFAKVISKELLT